MLEWGRRFISGMLIGLELYMWVDGEILKDWSVYILGWRCWSVFCFLRIGKWG